MKARHPQAAVSRLALFVTLCVVATASRSPIWGDAFACWNASVAMVNRGRPSVGPRPDDNQETRWDTVAGPDGNRYCKYAALQTLQCVPLVVMMQLLHVAMNDLPWFLLLAALVPAVQGGLLVAGLFLIAREFGVPPRRAAALCLVVFFGSPLWVYARYYYGEIQQACILVWLYYTWIRWRPTPSPRAFAIHGVLIGLALNAKTTLLLFAPIWACDLLWRKRPWRECGRFALWAGLGFLPGLLSFVWYNHVRYGTVFALGYAGEGFDTPILKGAYGLLLSSGKSIFLYFPLMILAVSGFRRFFRRAPAIAVGLAVPSVALFGVIACWWAWSGDFGWGPRLLVPLVPLAAVVSIAQYQGPEVRGQEPGDRTQGAGVSNAADSPLATQHSPPVTRRAAWVVLGTLGILVNATGVLIHDGSYLDRVAKRPGGLERSRFIPDESPLVAHAFLILDALARNNDEQTAVPGDSTGTEKPIDLDVWWTADTLGMALLACLLAGIALTGRSLLHTLPKGDGVTEVAR